MTEIFSISDAVQLQRKYRLLMQESERLAGVNDELSNSFYEEACKVMNQLNLIRRHNYPQTGNILHIG
jgi:hypothetical protein